MGEPRPTASPSSPVTFSLAPTEPARRGGGRKEEQEGEEEEEEEEEMILLLLMLVAWDCSVHSLP